MSSTALFIFLLSFFCQKFREKSKTLMFVLELWKGVDQFEERKLHMEIIHRDMQMMFKKMKHKDTHSIIKFSECFQFHTLYR